MNEEQIAVSIYNLQRSTKNQMSMILEVLALTDGDVDKSGILELYNAILNGEIEVVTVKSRVEVGDNARENLTKKIGRILEDKKAIFDFQVDKSLSRSLEVTIGDDILKL